MTIGVTQFVEKCMIPYREGWGYILGGSGQVWTEEKQKKVEEMRRALAVGDQVITIGGIMGKVVHVTEEDVTIETGEDRVRIQFKKYAISTNVKQEAAEAKK